MSVFRKPNLPVRVMNSPVAQWAGLFLFGGAIAKEAAPVLRRIGRGIIAAFSSDDDPAPPAPRAR